MHTFVNTFVYLLLPNAKRRKDQVQDVVGRGRSGNFVEHAQAAVEI